MFYDSTYIILIPGILISLWAQYKVNSTFNYYSRINTENNLNGAQVARKLLDFQGLYYVNIERISGKLTDHYDPANKVLRLSEEVYYGTSIASIGVAAHETGHAIQHQVGYSPLIIRNSIVPVVNFASNASWILLFAGLIMGYLNLINIGILLFAAVVVFQLITLPVEFNASSRALKHLKTENLVWGKEADGVKSVLNAAALTYIAAALTAILQLLRLIALRDRRRR